MRLYTLLRMGPWAALESIALVEHSRLVRSCFTDAQQFGQGLHDEKSCPCVDSFPSHFDRMGWVARRAKLGAAKG